jgi:hypothetical protein
MKKIEDLGDLPSGKPAVRTTIWVIMAVTLAGVFWFATTPNGFAVNSCTVCHKGTQTITVPCNSLDYRRHKDHGDPDGPCPGSTGGT